MLGPLAHAVHRAAGRLQHLPRARVDLAGHEERDEHVGELGEVAVALDEVVLVAAVGVAGGVGVVLEQVDLAADALLAEPLLGAADQALEVALPRLVVDDEILDRVALGRGVLGVAADVEVEAGAVLEEHVARAAPRHDAAEQVAGDLVGAQPALAAQRAGDAVLVLEPEDASIHVVRLLPGGATTDAHLLVGCLRRGRERHRAKSYDRVMDARAMTLLTSVGGTFRAHVLLARLESEGIDAQLRGAVDGAYGFTVGDMARVDVYVPTDQLDDARYVLLADEVDDSMAAPRSGVTPVGTPRARGGCGSSRSCCSW